MPPFAGDEVRARQAAAIHDDPASDSRAEDDAEHDVRARGRAVGGLGEREAVSVVHEPPRAVQQLPEIACECPTVEPGRVGVLLEPDLGHACSWYADAHRSGLA